MCSLGQVNMFELDQVSLDLRRNLSNANIIVALVLLGAESAEESVLHVAVELDWAVSVLFAGLVLLWLQAKCLVDFVEVLVAECRIFTFKLFYL